MGFILSFSVKVFFPFLSNHACICMMYLSTAKHILTGLSGVIPLE